MSASSLPSSSGVVACAPLNRVDKLVYHGDRRRASTGFERVPPVSTGSFGDHGHTYIYRSMSVILKYVSVLFCHSLTGFKAQEVSVILKYVSILSLTGFERVLPVSTGSVGDTEVCVSFVTDRL